jgi:hypothetical protein
VPECFILFSVCLSVPLSLSLSLSLLRASTEPFENCLESKCCTSEPAFVCMKRSAKPFAQCRRVFEGKCESDGSWECPGWEDCTTPSYGNCYESQCCSDQSQACLKRKGRPYAQCRHVPRGGCVEDDTWECPGWKKPPGPPPPRGAPSSAGASEATPACSQPFQPCTETHCCNSKAFQCIEKRNRFFAQCIRPETCTPGEGGNTCKNVEGEPVIPIKPLGPAPAGGAARAPAAAARPVAAAPSAASAGGGGDEGGVSTGLLVLLFLIAVVSGSGGMIWYRFYYVPKPPTRPPQAEDASEITPAPPPKAKTAVTKKVKKGASKQEKASMLDDQDVQAEEEEEEEPAPRARAARDDDSDDDESGNGKNGKASKPPPKKPAKKADPKPSMSMDMEDEMDL